MALLHLASSLILVSFVIGSSAQFTAEPHDVTVFEGDTVWFNCTANNTGAIPIWVVGGLSYSWTQLPDKHQYDFMTRALIVTDADLGMNGMSYQCFLSGTGTSDVGTLFVKPIQEISTTQLSSSSIPTQTWVNTCSNTLCYLPETRTTPKPTPHMPLSKGTSMILYYVIAGVSVAAIGCILLSVGVCVLARKLIKAHKASKQTQCDVQEMEMNEAYQTVMLNKKKLHVDANPAYGVVPIKITGARHDIW